MEPTGSLVWPVADEVFTDINGDYSVTLPENSVIILLVKADASYADAVPTFSGSVVKWGQALSFNNTCTDIFSADVAVVSHLPRTGMTTLRGQVLLSSGKMQAEDPISLVDIVVERTAGPPVGATQTDVNGDFFFEDVEPDGSNTYTVRVNLPCVPNPDTYIITVSNEDVEINGLNFCVDADTTLIANCLLTGIGTDPDGLVVKKKAFIASDPATGEVKVTLDGERAVITVYSMTGAVLLPAMTVESGQMLPIGHLSTGIYIADVIAEGSAQRIRFPIY
ncbi:MAG: hypothetical protein K9J06_16210 [Flavobacteriales bacterium]|nr:hypothetical protein [Flavobacteriales bacterium]